MIPLHEPAFDVTDEAAILDALRSTWVSTGGPYVEKFEKDFASYVGSRFAISTCNGTVALQLMVESLRRIRNVSGPFEVIVPTLSFIATANAVIHSGGRPVLMDTAPGSLNVDSTRLREFVEAHYVRPAGDGLWRSRLSGLPLLAIMPAHIMGWSADMNAMADACRGMGVDLLEDAAEALGCFDSKGRHLGHDGLAAAFSFNGNKILTTGGGGMIVTNDAEFARRLKHISTTAKTDGLRFVHDEVGYNFRMVNLLAALGCSQLEKLPARISRKKSIKDEYQRALEGTGVSVYEQSNVVSNHWLVNVVFDEESTREHAMQELLAKGYGVRPLWTPFHLQPLMASFSQPEKAFPHAEEMWRRTLSLPSSPQLDDARIRECAGVILAAVQGQP